jgi:hypothetical protein
VSEDDGNNNNIRIGELLERAKLVSSADLAEALAVSKRLQVPIGRVLVMSGCVSEKTLRAAVEAQSLLRDRGISLDKAAEALEIVAKTKVTFEEALKEAVPAYVDGSSTNRLGEILMEFDLITEEQLQAALTNSIETGMQLGAVLCSMHIISPTLLPLLLRIQERIREGKVTRQQAAEEFKASYEMWSKARESFKDSGSGSDLQSLAQPAPAPAQEEKEEEYLISAAAQTHLSSPPGMARFDPSITTSGQTGLPLQPIQVPTLPAEYLQQLIVAQAAAFNAAASLNPAFSQSLQAIPAIAPIQNQIRPTPGNGSNIASQSFYNAPAVPGDAAAFERVISRKIKSQTSANLDKVQTPAAGFPRTMVQIPSASSTDIPKLPIPTPSKAQVAAPAPPSTAPPQSVIVPQNLQLAETLVDYAPFPAEPDTNISTPTQSPIEPIALPSIIPPDVLSTEPAMPHVAIVNAIAPTAPAAKTLVDCTPITFNIDVKPPVIEIEGLDDISASLASLDQEFIEQVESETKSETASAPDDLIKTLLSATQTASGNITELGRLTPSAREAEVMSNGTADDGEGLELKAPFKGLFDNNATPTKDMIPDTISSSAHNSADHKTLPEPESNLGPTETVPAALPHKQAATDNQDDDLPFLEVLMSAGYFSKADLDAALALVLLDTGALPHLLRLLNLLSADAMSNAGRCQALVASGQLSAKQAIAVLKAVRQGKSFSEAMADVGVTLSAVA